MKTQRKQHSKTNFVAPGRWTAYMAAAAATTLAGADSAKAAIHYSGLLNHKIGPGTPLAFHSPRMAAAFSLVILILSAVPATTTLVGKPTLVSTEACQHL